jgi:hypothetical protein
MTDEQVGLGFKVMTWLNDHELWGSNLYFDTQLGLLHIWWGHHQWEYEYPKISPLPEELKGN